MRAPLALAVAVCCVSAPAQLPRPQAPRPFLGTPQGKHAQEEPIAIVQVDAVVTDAGGRPVIGLTADDFDLTQDDKPQKISRFSYEDGTAGRTLVFVIDDLELSVSGVSASRRAVREFVEKRMRPSDRVSIVATSHGSGAQQQFSSDAMPLLRFLNTIQPAGPAREWVDANAAARGAMCQLRMVVENLRKEPGRKAVVFLSGGLRSAGRSLLPRSFTGVLDASSRSSVVLYDVDPEEPVAEPTGTPENPKAAVPLRFASRSLLELQTGLPDVARRTGGQLFEAGDPGTAIDRIAQDADGYYRLAYAVNESNFQFGIRYEKVQVKVKRPGLTVRTGAAVKIDQDVYQNTEDQLTRDGAIPFSSGALSMRLTPIFEVQPEGTSVDALIHLDVHNVSVTEDLKGGRSSQIQLAIATLGADADAVDQASNVLTLTLTGQAYETARKNGVAFSMRLPLRRTTPGGWQFWAVARDEATGRVGSASEFIHIPNLSSGRLALSSVTLESTAVASATADQVTAGAEGSAAQRIFRRGETMRFNYVVYNVSADNDKRGRVEVQVRLFRNGELVFEGAAIPLEFSASDNLRRLSATGTLTLTQTMPAGMYYFQLNVKDALAPPGKPSAAVQYTDFEVRP